MLLGKPKADGIFFAIWPRRTPEGRAVGWLHRHWIESWGWGSDGHWAYNNWIPERLYQTGVRREDPVRSTRTEADVAWDKEQAELHKNPPDYYSTPPDKSKCRNNDGRASAVPCWHPHCTCQTPCDEPPRRGGRDEPY